MVYDDFYNKLVELSLFAPTEGVRLSVLDLMIELDELTDCDDAIGEKLNAEFEALFS